MNPALSAPPDLTLAFMSIDLLWRNALGAIPLALAVALICRFARCRPSTRHALWLIVLLSLLAPPLLPALDFSDDLGASRFFATIQNDAKGQKDATGPHKDATRQTESAVPSTIGTPAACPPAQSPATVAPECSSPTQLLAPSNATSTGSDRSPTTLRTSASHPNPSEPRAPAPQPAIADQPREAQQPDRMATPSAPPWQPRWSNDWLDTGRPGDTWNQRFNSPERWREALASVVGMNAAPSSSIASKPSPDSASSAAKSDSASNSASPLASATTIEWRNWLVRVAAARDSIVSLAPIPTSLWLGGCLLLAVIMLVRVWRFRRVLHRALPADDDVVGLVRQCANVIGLRRGSVPRVLMTPRHVSPLIWCGAGSMRRTLLLPQNLWGDLDDTGRRAVLLHELAHLKRRDHWICWIEMLACAIYWWNPLAWWVRHRLRDEADYCCDAWVTAVLPGSRTAYARALLATRQYLNPNPSRDNTPAPPGLALGATSARTKRFARRLTMVMTERTTPRLSMAGTALALCLAAGAWLATPLWACPPEESNGGGPSQGAAVAAQKAEKTAKAAEKAAMEKAAAKASKADKTVVVTVPHEMVSPHVSVAAPAGASTFEKHMAERGQETVVAAQAAPQARIIREGPGGGGDGSLEDRINRLEQRMDRLSAQLERLLGGGAGGSGQGATIAGPGGVRGRIAVPVQPKQPSEPAPRRAAPAPPAPPAPPATPAPPGTPGARSGPAGAVGMGPGMAPGTTRRPGAASGMGGGGMAMAAPAPADTGEQIVRFYELPDGKRDSLFELMKREDVPVLVGERDGGIEVHATAAQHRAIAAFIKVIHPEAKIEGLAPEGAFPRGQGPALQGQPPRAGGAAALSGAQRQQVEARVRDARAQLERSRQQQGEQLRRSIEQQQRQIEQQRRQAEQQSDQARKRVEELMKKSEQLRHQAEELKAKAQTLKDGREKEETEAKAEALESQAEQLQAQAEAERDALEAQMEALHDQLEAQQEAMQDQIEAQQDALESQLEGQLAALEAEAEAALGSSEAGEATEPPEAPAPAPPPPSSPRP